MRQILALSLLAGIGVLAPAPAAFSCDQHKTTAAAAEGHGGMACCTKHKGAATTARVSTADDYGVVLASSAAGCPYAKAKADAVKADMKDCPMHKARMEGREINTKGRVLCKSCDLKEADECRSVFRASDGKGTFALCPAGVTPELEKITKHGEVEVTVHGRIVNLGGEDVLCLEGFSVGTI